MNRLEAEAYLADKAVWSCVIRPSSLGLSHLTLTWKIAESREIRPDNALDTDAVVEAKAVCAHIDIEEEEKDSLNLRALGQKLIIDRRKPKSPNDLVSATPHADGYVYGSLDELLVRHVEPMAQQHKALRASKVYLDASLDAVYGELKRLLKEKPGSAPYFVSPDLEKIGFYQISYILRSKPHSESIKVVPGGLLYKGVISSDWRRMIDDFKARVRVNPKEDAARAAAEKANLAKQAASKSATGSTSVAPLGSSRSAQQVTQSSSYGASLFPYGGGAGSSAVSSSSASAVPPRNSRWASAASASSTSAPAAPSMPSVIGYDVNWGTSSYGGPQNYGHPASQTPSMGGSSDWRSSASQIQPQILQQHNQQTMPVYGAYPPMQMQMQQPPPPQPYQYQAAGGAYPGLQWNQPQQQQQQQPGFIGGYGIPQQQQQRGGSGRY
jgi:transcription elongation factor SPT6